jgi:hypothetical protein
VDYDGRVLTQCDPGAGSKIVVGPIDLAALRHERDRRQGHQLLAHLRTEAYTEYAHGYYPAGGADQGPVTVPGNNAATSGAWDILKRRWSERLGK